MEPAVPQLPGAGEALHRIANLVLILAGATVFTTLVVSIIPIAGSIGFGSYAVLIGAFAVWCAGFLPDLVAERAGLQCYSLVVLLAAPYVLSTTCSEPWIDIGLVAIGAILGAVLAMPLSRSLRLIGFVLILDASSVLLPRPTVSISDSWLPVIGQWAGPLFLLVMGVGYAIWRSNWAASAKATDDAFISAQQALLASRRNQAVLAAQQQSQRRLHETMLNTLFAVGKGVGRTNRSLVMETCKADLGNLDTSSRYVASAPIGAVIADAADVLHGQLVVEITGAYEPLLSALSAGALRDAIVEALRNVVRHARTTRASIHTTVEGATARVRIVDHGIGFSSVPDQHFGLRRAIQEPINLLGGAVEVTSEPGEGTEVELTLPVEVVNFEPETSPAVLSIVVGPLAYRLASIAAIFFGLATVAMVCAMYSNWWILMSAYLVFAACVIAGAILWESKYIRPIAVLTFISLSISLLCVLALHPDGDGPVGQDAAASVTFDWLINGGFAATIISLLALPPRFYAWIPFSFPFLAAVIVIVESGETSTPDRFASLAQAFVFMALGIYAVTTLFKAIEIQRSLAVETWNRVHDTETRAQEESHWDDTISGVPDSVVALVSAIASGEMDPGQESVIAGARDEELILRWYLLEMRDRGTERAVGNRMTRRRDPLL